MVFVADPETEIRHLIESGDRPALLAWIADTQTQAWNCQLAQVADIIRQNTGAFSVEELQQINSVLQVDGGASAA